MVTVGEGGTAGQVNSWCLLARRDEAEAAVSGG